MFYTGVFALDSQATFREHDENHVFDDDVLSWFGDKEKQKFVLQPDGYVSNVGNIVTIHIVKELIGTKYENEVKREFELNTNNDNIDIIIEELPDNSSILIY